MGGEEQSEAKKAKDSITIMAKELVMELIGEDQEKSLHECMASGKIWLDEVELGKTNSIK